MELPKEQLAIMFKEIAQEVTDEILKTAAFQLSQDYDTLKKYLEGEIVDVGVGNKLFVILQTRIIVKAAQLEDFVAVHQVINRMINILDALTKTVKLISDDSMIRKEILDERLDTIISLLKDKSISQKIPIRKSVPSKKGN
jgi:hypothetical protein